MFYYSSTMPCPCALMSYSLISVTICAPCVYYEELMSLDITSNPNSDLDCSRLCHMTSRSCALPPL